MNHNFITKTIGELRDYISENRTFLRYDVSDFYNSYNKAMKKFNRSKHRNMFIYELLDSLLNSLDSKLSSQIKKDLHSKDFNWFKRIGQYFFFNLTQWYGCINPNGQDILSLFNATRKDFFEKWWKYFLRFEQNQRTENEDTPSYPEKVLLELTNNCNLNCIMCGIGAYGYDKSRNMSLDLVDRLSKHVLSKVKTIRINGLGESTIIPNILEYLQKIFSLNKQLEIVTNLTVQNENLWSRLLNKHTNMLISCDSADPQTYETIRRGANFNSFLKNLKFIGENINHPLQAQIIFTLMKQNLDDLPEVIELSSQHNLGGVVVNVVKLDTMDYFSKKEIDTIKQTFEKSYNLARDYGLSLKLPDHIGNVPINSQISTKTCKEFCSNPGNEVYIRYNGDLTPCNMLNPYIYGNLELDSFSNLWTGLNASIFRHFLNTHHRHHYCRNCYYLL